MNQTLFFLLFLVPILAVDRLAFVYELVRHGARAPLDEEPAGYFHVPKGHLTEIGMRQRHLLGKLNRAKYVDRY